MRWYGQQAPKQCNGGLGRAEKGSRHPPKQGEMNRGGRTGQYLGGEDLEPDRDGQMQGCTPGQGRGRHACYCQGSCAHAESTGSFVPLLPGSSWQRNCSSLSDTADISFYK